MTDENPTDGGPAKTDTRVDVVDNTLGVTLAGPLTPAKAEAMISTTPASHKVVTKPHRAD